MNDANLIISTLWLILVVYWLVSAAGTKRTLWRQSDWRHRVAIQAVLIAVLALVSSKPSLWNPLIHGYLFAPSWITATAGVTLSAVGLGFAIWARTHLGRNWGMPMTVRENPDLVTSGPYGLVRHPIYTGILIAELGSALVGGNIWLFSFAVCLAYFTYSAIKEEKLMTQQFPDQYPEYKMRSKMLIPYVW